MKKKAQQILAVLFVVSAVLLVTPQKAQAHADFLVTIARMATVLPGAVFRGGVFFVEGAFDGVIEGLLGRQGFLHGESRYL